MVTVALMVPMMAVSVPVAVAADADFAGGPLLEDMPTYVPNDHTALALRFAAVDAAEDTLTALLPNTVYEVKIRLAPTPTPSNVQNRGYVWSGSAWTFNRGPAWGEGNFPTVTTDADGNITQSPWIFFKFGNELNSGTYYILVSLNAGVEGATRNAATKPMVTVLDMKTNGTHVHAGAASATTLQNERRVIVAPGASTNSTGTVWAISRTETNTVDTDSNGIIDDEDWGPAGKPGDYRLAAPSGALIDVYVQQNRRVNDFQLAGPDEDIALGSADTTAPAAPTALDAVPGETAISLSWNASTDDVGVAGYSIYRWVDVNDVVYTPVHELIGTTAELTFDDSTALPGVTYNYEVRAVDAATNGSARSNNAAAMINRPPVAVDDAYNASQGTPLTIAAPGVLANDTDPDGDPLVAELAADPAHGAITLNANGSFSYVPDPGFVGVDSFIYLADDGTEFSAAATVTITVSAVPFHTTEIAGANRYATAIAASVKAFPAGSDYVIIATGANWPDALGGSALAGALDAPILLTGQNVLPAEVRAEIVRLKGTRPSITAIVLGGTPAVSAAVYGQIDAITGVSVERIAGANRYDTAIAVAARTIQVLGDGYDGTAFVATGLNFPDALGASPLAAAAGWPIYLANPNQGNNAGLVSVMKAAGVTDAILLGGSNVVSDAIKTPLGATYETRLAGANRYDTAVAVATYGVANAGLGWNKVALATGANFPDALSGGVLQGADGSVLLLTPTASLNANVAAKLAANKAAITEIRFLGSTAAVSAATRTAALNALK